MEFDRADDECVLRLPLLFVRRGLATSPRTATPAARAARRVRPRATQRTFFSRTADSYPARRVPVFVGASNRQRASWRKRR